MLISDLSHLEVVSEDNNVVGGLAVATAGASAYANGPNFSGTNTNTYTSAYRSSYYYPYYSPTNSSSSSSNSSSSAE